MIVASTVAGLGTPVEDGVLGLLRIVGADIVQELLVWNLAQQAWVGRPKSSMKQIDSPWGMTNFGSPADWAYPSTSEGAGQIDTGFGFHIHPVNHAGVLCGAGLRLQEHLSVSAKPQLAGPAASLALNWYAMDIGDTFLSPPPTNLGVVLHTQPETNGAVHKFSNSGWQNTPAAIASKKSYYPELYIKDDNITFRDFTALHRWVGGTLGATGGSDNSDHRPPIIDKLLQWQVADYIPKIDTATIENWTDCSGYNRHLLQSNSAKKPVLVKNALNGRAVVRFDGVDDFLQTLNAVTAVQPYTIFVVLKQYGGAGGTQQIWVEGEAAVPPLIYRADATDQVDFWAGGGGDIIYHRGTAWPSPYFISSTVFSGASSNIWENKTLKVTGNGGAADMVGMTLGAARDGTLPAKIDVAEIIVYSKALNDADRNSVCDYLNTKYSLF